MIFSFCITMMLLMLTNLKEHEVGTDSNAIQQTLDANPHTLVRIDVTKDIKTLVTQEGMSRRTNLAHIRKVKLTQDNVVKRSHSKGNAQSCFQRALAINHRRLTQSHLSESNHVAQAKVPKSNSVHGANYH